MTLPIDPKARKSVPVFRGALAYFPDAIAAVAELSAIASKQHGHERMHWDRSKSSDHADALARHLLEVGTVDTDGVRHAAKVAWRALALLQVELDAAAAEPPRDTEPAPAPAADACADEVDARRDLWECPCDSCRSWRAELARVRSSGTPEEKVPAPRVPVRTSAATAWPGCATERARVARVRARLEIPRPTDEITAIAMPGCQCDWCRNRRLNHMPPSFA